mmetsp:Transcript_11617/g.29296  ORF Transcript_11617/g.29296 Transcript_11617/m.29296 type:complete len:227 (-) Transcript_11617:33-713(-)
MARPRARLVSLCSVRISSNTSWKSGFVPASSSNSRASVWKLLISCMTAFTSGLTTFSTPSTTLDCKARIACNTGEKSGCIAFSNISSTLPCDAWMACTTGVESAADAAASKERGLLSSTPRVVACNCEMASRVSVVDSWIACNTVDKSACGTSRARALPSKPSWVKFDTTCCNGDKSKFLMALVNTVLVSSCDLRMSCCKVDQSKLLRAPAMIDLVSWRAGRQSNL